MLEAAGSGAGATRDNDAGDNCAGFGLVLRHGVPAVSPTGDLEHHRRPITVSRVVPDSPADRSAPILFNSYYFPPPFREGCEVL